MKNGIFRLYELLHGEGQPETVLVGRFMIHNKVFSVLEDNTGLLSSHVSEGPMTEDHEKFLKILDTSPYFKVVSEQHIAQGLHDDLIEDANWGEVNPEARYLLIGDGEPCHLETYGDHIVKDGKQMSDDEVKAMMEEVRSGKMRMLPV